MHLKVFESGAPWLACCQLWLRHASLPLPAPAAAWPALSAAGAGFFRGRCPRTLAGGQTPGATGPAWSSTLGPCGLSSTGTLPLGAWWTPPRAWVIPGQRLPSLAIFAQWLSQPRFLHSTGWALLLAIFPPLPGPVGLWAWPPSTGGSSFPSVLLQFLRTSQILWSGEPGLPSGDSSPPWPCFRPLALWRTLLERDKVTWDPGAGWREEGELRSTPQTGLQDHMQWAGQKGVTAKLI